jgi:peptidoglycan/xylan/chitin deacetylase (PgdA/CDA1 family)
MFGRAKDLCRQRAHNAACKIGRVQWSLLEGSSAVALTFDDGPDPRFTPKTLDVLRRFQVPATFFLVGARAREYPELVRQIVDEGHSVGSHSDTHPDVDRLRWAAVLREYKRGRDSVSAIAGRRVRLFRPPKGWIDLPRNCLTRLLGLQLWMWSSAGHDWMPGITADEILGHVGILKGGEVILMHDGAEQPLAPEALDRSSMIEALERLIPEVRRQGLHFVALR